MKRVILGLILLSFLFLSSCSGVPSETTKPMKILFCHEDDCAEELISLIEESQEIVCALYDLNDEKIVNALNEKNALIILEKQNRKRTNNLLLHKKYDESKYLMHNKFCVFDNSIVWTGSWNPTNNKNHDNVLIIYSKYLAKNYKKEFSELWDSGEENVLFPKIILNEKNVENYFCPEDNCAERVLEKLEKAEKSIYFMLFSFTDDKIGNLLKKKAEEGVKVSGLMEKTQLNEWSEDEKLKEYVGFYKGKGLLHHKVFIIDEKIVITGSYNPTKAGDTKNDENIVIIKDRKITKRFVEELEKLS